MVTDNTFFGTEPIGRILLRLAPPIMLAQLIQALYNIVDSYFIGQYSVDGLAALSIIFPVQLLMSALAIGTGVGVNTVMSKLDGASKRSAADEAAGTGFLLSVISWVVFALLSCAAMRVYAQVSLSSAQAQDFACTYGMIVCGLSFGIFLESNWTKILQARGDMKTPMIAQIAGAVTNIILDWLLIFGVGIFPKLGITGAALATVAGQILAAVIVGVKAFEKVPPIGVCIRYIKPIYTAGIPNILMNALCTIYIVALNLILVGFSDEAVTVLGLYYKLQTFLLIPVLGLDTCIIPILSYNYSAGRPDRCKEIVKQSILISIAFMIAGTVLFELFPSWLLGIFANEDRMIIQLGVPALRIIAAGFIPITVTIIIPTYFQALGMGVQSIFISVLRQILLLIPLAWVFSLLGLRYVWLAFPITEYAAAAASYFLYRKYPLKELKYAD